MKLIIAGGRDIKVSIIEIDHLLRHFGLEPTLIICGMASGVDAAGKAWADARGVQVIPFIPTWEDLNAPGARIKTNKFGKPYNANAGHDRNRLMAMHGDCLLLIWNGRSSGSASMKTEMLHLEKKLYEVVIPSKN